MWRGALREPLLAAPAAAPTPRLLSPLLCCAWLVYGTLYASVLMIASFFPTSPSAASLSPVTVGAIFAAFPLATFLATPLPPLVLGRLALCALHVGVPFIQVRRPWVNIGTQAVLSFLQFVALSIEVQVASTDRSFPIHHAHHSKEADDDPCHLHSVVPIHEAPRTPVGGGKWGTLRQMAAARELSGSKEKKAQSLGSMPEGQLSSKSRMPSVIVHAVKASKTKTAPPSPPPSTKMVTDGEPVILSRAVAVVRGNGLRARHVRECVGRMAEARWRRCWSTEPTINVSAAVG